MIKPCWELYTVAAYCHIGYFQTEEEAITYRDALPGRIDRYKNRYVFVGPHTMSISRLRIARRFYTEIDGQPHIVHKLALKWSPPCSVLSENPSVPNSQPT